MALTVVLVGDTIVFLHVVSVIPVGWLLEIVMGVVVLEIVMGVLELEIVMGVVVLEIVMGVLVLVL